MVYNANKLADLVEEKKKKQNWLDYYELKFSRQPDQRPTTKVIFLQGELYKLFNLRSRYIYHNDLFKKLFFGWVRGL